MTKTTKGLLLFVVFVILSTTALACQYTEQVINSTTTGLVARSNDGEILVEPIFEFSPNCYDALKITNPNSVPIDFTLDITLAGGYGTNKPAQATSTIRARYDIHIDEEEMYELFPTTEWAPAHNCKLFRNDYTFTWKDNNYMNLKVENIHTYRTECKMCGGKLCIDDGAVCQLDAECGYGDCNNAGICGPFTGCLSNQLSCNDGCAIPSVKKSGEAYSCDWECKSGNGKEGICKPMKGLTLIIISSALILLIIIIFIIRKIFPPEPPVDTGNGPIMNEPHEGKESEEDEADKYWKKIKPFPDPQASNKLVIVNPYLGGYRCFYKKGLPLKNYPSSSLVHRWVWKHHNGRDPMPGYHIHHKNGDKYDNRISNLEEIFGPEHYGLHRNHNQQNEYEDGEDERPKKYNCQICGRPINHKGNCLGCNMSAKR